MSTPHLLGIEDLTPAEIRAFLDAGRTFRELFSKSSTAHQSLDLLRGKTVVGLFYEASTRTRCSFEMAATRLGAHFLYLAADASSSVSKGETLLDTARNLEAMGPDMLVLRHPHSGAPHSLAPALRIPVINAGDGFHEHPTQGLLDALTMEERFGNLAGLRVTIVGDIAHSRVARSNMHLLKKMGAEVTVCGPPTLIPPGTEKLGVRVSYDLREAVLDADVVMMLRIQFERQNDKQIPSTAEYYRCFGLSPAVERELKAGAIVMHPGPMNRGVEIASEVADGPRSVIMNQVTNGVALRAGVLAILSGAKL